MDVEHLRQAHVEGQRSKEAWQRHSQQMKLLEKINANTSRSSEPPSGPDWFSWFMALLFITLIGELGLIAGSLAFAVIEHIIMAG